MTMNDMRFQPSEEYLQAYAKALKARDDWRKGMRELMGDGSQWGTEVLDKCKEAQATDRG